MNLKRLLRLALFLALVLAVTVTAASALAHSDVSAPVSINSGSCPSETARLRNNGLHRWNRFDVVAASCTQPETAWYRCVYCDQTMTQTFGRALGHSWSGSKVLRPATCENTGEQLRVCSYCGLDETQTIAALGHNWGAWQTVDAATCESAGLRRRQCHRCQKVESEILPALSHNWGEWRVEYPGTCETQGMNVRRCVNCGQEQYVYSGLGDHAWDEGETVVKPGALVDGLMLYTCKTNPEHTKTEPIPALGTGLPLDDAIPGFVMRPPLPPDGIDLSKLHIIDQPEGGKIERGDVTVGAITVPLELSVTAGGGEPPYTYQWYMEKVTTPERQIQTPVSGGRLGSTIQRAVQWAGSVTRRSAEGWRSATITTLAINRNTPFEAAQKTPSQLYTGGISLREPRVFEEIPGATDSTYPVSKGGRHYKVRVFDNVGTYVDSDLVYVGYFPYITVQPKNAIIGQNASSVTLTVDAAGGEPYGDLGYKITWYDGNDNEKKTGTTATDNGYEVTESGQYYCVITDSVGDTVTSNTVRVRKAAPLSISVSAAGRTPTDVTVTINGGAPPFHVIWDISDINLKTVEYVDQEGVEDRSITRRVTTPGFCYVSVYDDSGANDCQSITVYGPQLTITEQPKDGQLRAGGTVPLTVSVSGTAPYDYNLIRNGQEYDFYGSVSSNTQTFDVDDTGTYTIQITDSAGRYGETREVKVTASNYKNLEIVSYTDVVYTNDINGASKVGVTVQGGTPPYKYDWEIWWPANTRYGTVNHFNYGNYIYHYAGNGSSVSTGANAHTRFICTVTDAEGESVVSQPMYFYYDGAPVIKEHPKNATGSGVTRTTYLYCRALPGRTYDQSVLMYQWQYYSNAERAWVNYGSPEIGKNTDNFRSTLAITGTAYGKTYRCMVTDLRDGSQTHSRPAHVTVGMSYWNFHQVGSSTDVELNVTGGLPPYTIYAKGYHYFGDREARVLGITVDSTEGDFKCAWKTAYPVSVVTDQDGVAHVRFHDLYRYYKFVAWVDVYLVVPVWHYEKTPYYWTVYVKDSLGTTLTTEELEMTW